MFKNDTMYVNLKILSKLQPFQRINTRAQLFKISGADPDGWTLGIPEFVMRWWSNATRDSDFNRIKDLYEEAQTELERSSVENIRLKEHLLESMKGLASLQKTYENDVTMKARIDTLIERVEAMCKDPLDD